MQSLLPQTKVLWSRHGALQTRSHKRRGVAQRAGVARRGGFTLIELMVVLAIAVLVTSITVNGFRELSDSNKRTSCQTNLHQVYQGLRLYMNDEAGGVPLYYPNPGNTTERNIGLWALYTYPKDGSPNDLADLADKNTNALFTGSKPVGRYIRNPKVLHCPAGFIDGETKANVEVDREHLYLDENRTKLNPNYLSYQVSDDGPNGLGTTFDANKETYFPARTTKRSDPNWKRQLRLLDGSPPIPVAGAQPQDDTIVTWCRWHQVNRGFDNVLFFDGSVQYIQHEQPNPNPAAAATEPILYNWERKPKPIVP